MTISNDLIEKKIEMYYILKKEYFLRNRESILSLKKTRSAFGDFKLMHNKRYYSVLVSLSLPKDAAKRSIKLTVMDSTAHVKKQLDCVNENSKKSQKSADIVKSIERKIKTIIAPNNARRTYGWDNLSKIVAINTNMNVYRIPVKYLDGIARSSVDDSLSSISLIFLYPNYEGRTKDKKEVFRSFKSSSSSCFSTS